MKISNYRIGDIVKDFDGSVWGETNFEVVGFEGNDYCPILLTIVCGKFYPNGKPWKCNLNARLARLMDSSKRPFIKLPERQLIKMIGKGIVEAKRELIIRRNKS